MRDNASRGITARSIIRYSGAYDNKTFYINMFVFQSYVDLNER